MESGTTQTAGPGLREQIPATAFIGAMAALDDAVAKGVPMKEKALTVPGPTPAIDEPNESLKCRGRVPKLPKRAGSEHGQAFAPIDRGVRAVVLKPTEPDDRGPGVVTPNLGNPKRGVDRQFRPRVAQIVDLDSKIRGRVDGQVNVVVVANSFLVGHVEARIGFFARPLFFTPECCRPRFRARDVHHLRDRHDKLPKA